MEEYKTAARPKGFDPTKNSGLDFIEICCNGVEDAGVAFTRDYIRQFIL